MPKGTTEPGELSAAMAAFMDALIKRSGKTREAVAAEAGIASGRISALLNGKKPWYLEDVERICNAIGADPIDALSTFTTSDLAWPNVGVVVDHPGLASVIRFADPDEQLLDVAMDMDRPPGSTIEED